MTNEQEPTLADRMQAAGMMTVDEMLAGAPMDGFIRHAGVHDLDTYGQWLELKCREYLAMQARYELGDKPRDDLYEWVVAHAAVFQAARINFNASRPAAQPAKFRLGDRVRKTGRSSWQGIVVGTYSSSITPEGYAVESECHPGSVQIYPAEWLEKVGDEG